MLSHQECEADVSAGAVIEGHILAIAIAVMAAYLGGMARAIDAVVGAAGLINAGYGAHARVATFARHLFLTGVTHESPGRHEYRKYCQYRQC